MKSSLNVLSVCLCLFPAMIQAATLTVDNKPGAVAQYTNLKTAVDAAQEGDTILIAASNIEYVGDGAGNGLTISKRVHLVGPGYLLAENSIPGVDPRTAVIASLDFTKEEFVGDATGSSLTGLQLASVFTSQVGNQGYPQITIDRCSLSSVVIHNGTIRRSLGNFSVYGAGTAAVNCIGYVNVYEGAAASHCTLFSISTQAGCSISNSIFAVGLPSSPPTAAIFLASIQGAAISNCMAINGSYLPAGNGNINGAALNSVFLNTGSDDAKWQLKAGSPALGAGAGGVNLGAFGGVAPYILSGVPGIPRITRMVVPPVVTTGSGFTFEVDAKSFGN